MVVYDGTVYAGALYQNPLVRFSKYRILKRKMSFFMIWGTLKAKRKIVPSAYLGGLPNNWM